MLALTRTVSMHDSALSIDSPHGMLLYGEVGRGKSMLLDLLYTSLPSRKKRRWHFNTFMLDIFRRLELSRIQRSSALHLDHEHVVLSLAKQTIETSPILFLDEFQMPDRTSSKLLNGFMTAFFHLGGVLVASSNRMPEELAKASGVEFAAMRARQGGIGGWMRRSSENDRAAQSDFGQFLEILKTRCDVWEMEGERDWRRESEDSPVPIDLDTIEDETPSTSSSGSVSTTSELDGHSSSDSPPHYHIALSPNDVDPSFNHALSTLNPSSFWTPRDLHVYGRTLHIQQTHGNTALLLFPSLCSANLGPADYVSLCSTFHTLIITDIPVLTLLQKNEARRFITLLDALYESKCRLLIRAAAPPDHLFFPETRTRSGEAGSLMEGDSIESEAFSEMYQDATSPFRPNISSYTEQNLSSSTPSSSYTNAPAEALRSVLADEDADFGPTYGNGRGHGMSMPSGPEGMAELERRQGPDFTQTGALTGEDERFAYKRARSRLWEMCGRRWWQARPADRVEEWWMPVGSEGRFWEKKLAAAVAEADADAGVDSSVTTTRQTGPGGSVDGSHDGTRRRIDGAPPGVSDKEDALFRHGASPFRTRADPPPKFGWQHAWGMMQWGKKAGEWGRGVEGDRSKDSSGEGNAGKGREGGG